MNESFSNSNVTTPESTNAQLDSEVVCLSVLEFIEQNHLTFTFEFKDTDGETDSSLEFFDANSFAMTMAIEAGNFVNTADRIQFMQWALSAMAIEARRVNGEYSIDRTVRIVESLIHKSGPWTVRFVQS